MRVVLATNIWVSGLLWRGLPWSLLRLAALGQVVPCMAPEMLGELAGVLAYERLRPRLQSLRLEAADLVSYAMSLTTFFDVPSGPIIVSADPDDDIFLRCATVANAVYVVNGDQHLLALKSYAGIAIMTVHDFLAAEFPEEIEL